jgi:hypothetical protein
VHADARIEFERRLYPVPWRLIGKQVWVQATPKTIAVYWEETRVATHQRNKPVPPEVYDQYLPDQRSAWRYRSQSYWIERAERLGADVVAYVREIFACDDVLMRRHGGPRHQRRHNGKQIRETGHTGEESHRRHRRC